MLILVGSTPSLPRSAFPTSLEGFLGPERLQVASPDLSTNTTGGCFQSHEGHVKTPTHWFTSTGTGIHRSLWTELYGWQELTVFLHYLAHSDFFVWFLGCPILSYAVTSNPPFLCSLRGGWKSPQVKGIFFTLIPSKGPDTPMGSLWSVPAKLLEKSKQPSKTQCL